MLNGVPVMNRVNSPPRTAIGITLAASAMSRTEPKLKNSSNRIRPMLSGTTTLRRSIAFWRLPNSPAHSM